MRAMFAAKAGHSTLGIPQQVGADFVAATPSASGLPAHAHLMNALKKHLLPKPPMMDSGDAETPADAASGDAEETLEAPSVAQKMAHHKRLMVHAPTPAARAVHKKLYQHHKNALGLA